jgi:hypothetical protein
MADAGYWRDGILRLEWVEQVGIVGPKVFKGASYLGLRCATPQAGLFRVFSPLDRASRARGNFKGAEVRSQNSEARIWESGVVGRVRELKQRED